MTLDEAIIHCEQVAREKEACDMYDKCGLEHRQLAEWLRDYKWLKFADVTPVVHGQMKIKNWTVGELVAYLSGNQQTNKPGIPVLDEWLHSSLQGDKGLVSGTLLIELNMKQLRAMKEIAERKEYSK